MDSQKSEPRFRQRYRRWLRFRLIHVLVLMTIICVWLAYYTHRERQRYRQATIDGKYSVLLRRVRIPRDVRSYGEVNDWGYWEGTEYGGFTELPQGYWVYVEPDWYVWGESTGGRRAPTTGFRSGYILDAF
jgi:hypothetical protein